VSFPDTDRTSFKYLSPFRARPGVIGELLQIKHLLQKVA